MVLEKNRPRADKSLFQVLEDQLCEGDTAKGSPAPGPGLGRSQPTEVSSQRRSCSELSGVSVFL